MRGRDLRANARGALRYDRIEKANYVNAFLQHARSELLRLRCVANHDWDDRMHSRLDGQATVGQRGAKIFCVFLQLVAQFSRCAEKFERFQRRGDHRWRNRVGKQIWSRSLPQKIDNLLTSAGESAAGAAECFAEGPGDDVDPTHHAAIFVGTAPGLSEKTG